MSEVNTKVTILTDDPNDIRNWLDELEAESWNDWSKDIDDNSISAKIEQVKEFCANYNMSVPDMEEYIFKKGPSLGIPFDHFIKYAKKYFLYDCTFHIDFKFRKMSDSSPLEPLRALTRVLQDTVPPPRELMGYTYVPRFINPPPFELTKPMICGVDCDEVYPSIFVGDEGSARKKEFLVKVGITHVLNTAAGVGFGQVNTGAEFYADCGIHYLGLDLIDAPRTRIIDYFDQGVSFMDECLKNNGKVLVHCLMGLSRSSTFVAAYLMIKKNMTALEALRTIRKQREVRPNDGFLVQLLQLEAKGLEKK